MLEAFGFLYALLKAVPIFNKWVQDFFVFYAQKQTEWAYAAISKGVTKAFRDGDQRDLEHAIGSPRADKPSGHDGVEYDDPNAP